MSKRDDILGAIRCCRKDRCEQCPLQQTICDELHVEMTEMPTELVDMIEEELAEE